MDKYNSNQKHVDSNKIDSAIIDSKAVRKVIKMLEKEFSSHDFIQKYASEYEEDYINLLYKYKRFQTAHQQIGLFLEKNVNEFGFRKSILNGNIQGRCSQIRRGKIESKNIFGNLNEVQYWEKL